MGSSFLPNLSRDGGEGWVDFSVVHASSGRGNGGSSGEGSVPKPLKVFLKMRM